VTHAPEVLKGTWFEFLKPRRRIELAQRRYGLLARRDFRTEAKDPPVVRQYDSPVAIGQRSNVLNSFARLPRSAGERYCDRDLVLVAHIRGRYPSERFATAWIKQQMLPNPFSCSVIWGGESECEWID
jgi:hypothetical protein